MTLQHKKRRAKHSSIRSDLGHGAWRPTCHIRHRSLSPSWEATIVQKVASGSAWGCVSPQTCPSIEPNLLVLRFAFTYSSQWNRWWEQGREEHGGEQILLTWSNSRRLCLSLCHMIEVHCAGLQRPCFALWCLSYMQSRPWVPFTDRNLATRAPMPFTLHR